MFDLNGKTAWVTGSSRGIGRDIARALAEAGATVVVSYNTNAAAARDLASEIAAPFAVQLDTADPDNVLRAVRRVEDGLGRLDILVNNAAIAQEKPFETISVGDWDAMMATNLRGPFLLCQALAPAMAKRGFGRIVNIASIGGQWGGFNQVHYAVAKAGLIMLTRSLAKIYSGQGVTTNAVAPGLVKTDMAAREIDSDEGKAKIVGIPAGRIAELREVSSAVVFLASGEAGHITGQTLNVNGGMLFG